MTMIYFVSKKCTKCLSCVESCPTGAFHDAASMVVINPKECIECGACVSVCPVKAIRHTEESPAEMKETILFNANQSQASPRIIYKSDSSQKN